MGRSVVGALLIAALAVIAGTSDGALLDPELQQMMSGSPPSSAYRVIVRMKERDPIRMLQTEVAKVAKSKRPGRVAEVLRKRAAGAQAGIRERLERLAQEGKAQRITPYWILPGFALTAPREVIEELAGRDDVERVEPDRVIKLSAPVPAPASVGRWNLDRIGVEPLWQAGFSGQGAVVATLDTGGDLGHPDVGPKWRGGANDWFVAYSSSVLPHGAPFDDNGHGTGVLGVMVGGAASGVPIGVAPEARWIAAKIFDSTGEARFTAIHAAFQWILDPDGNPATDDAPQVVNNSWDLNDTTGVYLNEFESDILALRAAGIGVMFAAGNAGPAQGTSTSPGNNAGALPVGATDIGNTVALFSSRGPSARDGTIYPAVVAPGVGIVTADRWFGSLPLSYTTVSGTSFSAPHVTGAMALLISADPTLTTDQVEAAIGQTGRDLGNSGPDNSYGLGLLNVEAAARVLGILAPASGDVDGDGQLTLRDILLVLRTAQGLSTPDVDPASVLDRGDVAPLPTPDGRITIADVLGLLRIYVRQQNP